MSWCANEINWNVHGGRSERHWPLHTNDRAKGYCHVVWDQVIADFIAPVLGRFDNKIRGSSLFKLLKISAEDVRTVNAARSRLSEDLHNLAKALNPAEVSHDDLAKEVDVLHHFIQSMANRPESAQPRIRPP